MSLYHRSILPLWCAVLALTVSSCGGSDEPAATSATGASTSTETGAETATSTGTGTGAAPGTSGSVRPQVETTIRVVRDGESTEFEREATVRSGDLVQVGALVRNAAQVRDMPLRITIPRGPTGRIEIVAQVGGEDGTSSRAVLRREGGGRLGLDDLRWNCSVSAANFCPVDAGSSNSERYALGLDLPSRPVRIVFSLSATA